MFVTSTHLHPIGSGLPLTSLGLDYQQGHTRPFFPCWSVKGGSSPSSILPQFLLVYLAPCDPASRLDHVSTCRFPPGLSARPPLDFPGLLVLLCRLGTPLTVTHTLLPTEFQLTSICHPAHFRGSKDTLPQTQDHFYH